MNDSIELPPEAASYDHTFWHPVSRWVGIAGHWGLVPLLIVAALLRIHHLSRWLPNFFEEATPVLRARDFWGWSTGAFDFYPHFFNYPALSFFLNFIVQAAYLVYGMLTGSIASLDAFRDLLGADLPTFILLGRLLTVLFDLGTVAVVYFLGRRLGGVSCGLLAGFLQALNALHIQLSQFVIVDIPLTFFTVVALYFMVAILEKGRSIDYLAAGLSLGLATATKYTAALLVVPLVATALLRQGDRSQFRAALPKLGLAGASALAVFFLVNPYILLDFSAFWERFSFERIHMELGHFGHDLEVSALQFYAQQVWSVVGIIGLAALGGMYHVRRTRDFRSIPMFVWIVIYLAVISSWSMRADRYLLPVIPALLLLTANGAVSLFSLPRRPTWKAVLLTSALLLYLVPQGTALRAHYTNVSGLDARLLTRHWVESELPAGSLVALESYSYAVENTSADSVHFLRIPMSVIEPVATAGFYDLQWYENFDYILISSAVYQRYLDKADTYPRQIEFYRQLQEHWQEVRHFVSRGMEGPIVQIYKNPDPMGVSSGSYGLLYQGLETAPPQLISYFLAQLAVNLGKVGAAARALEVAEKLALVERQMPNLSSRAARVYHSLGMSALQRGEMMGGIRALWIAAALGSDNADTHRVLKQALGQTAALFQRILADGDDSQAQFGLGLIYLLQGDFPGARAVYERGIGLFGTEEGRRVGAEEDLGQLVVQGINAAEARQLLQTYWPEEAPPDRRVHP